MALHLDDPAVTDLARWRKLAEAVLKGADFDESLTSKTADGIRIGRKRMDDHAAHR
jgi:hypothetical protein